MQNVHPVFPQTVIRISADSGCAIQNRIFHIYGVEQALNVLDPYRIVPRNDNRKL